MRTYKIAAVPGDGIGLEIVNEGARVLDAAAQRERFRLEYEHFDYSAGRYLREGAFMPEDALERLRPFDAIYFGAVGRPDVDDRWPAIKYTFRIRKGFQQYVNYRPVKLIPGVRGPLRDADPEKVDFIILRENTEGEFSETGNFVNPETPEGMALAVSVFTRKGIERIARFAFQLARKRRNLVTNVTKSNTLIHTMYYWDQVIAEVAREYSDVRYEKMYVDNACAQMVLRPERFDVMLTTNMIGDILSDLGGALMGSLGLGPSGNINPERQYPSMFEPIHGSAPDIMGKGIANPVSAIWSGALMLEHLGEQAAADRIVKAIFRVFKDGICTADLGGKAKTKEMTDAILERL